MTQRQQPGPELPSSEERLRLALEAARMGTWEWDLLSNRQVISPEAESLLGLAPGTYTGQTEQLWLAVLPEDRAQVRQTVRRAVQMGELDLEHRIAWPDGTVHWLASKGRVRHDANGRPVRLLGVVWDVTERKHADLALRREQEFSRGLIESSTDGIMAFDLEYCYTVWNPAMERITGLSRSAVLGRCAFDVFPFLREIGQDRFLAEALAGGTVTVTDRPYRVPETGRAGFFESQYAPIRDEAGAIIGGLGVIRDITDRKQAEAERAELQREHAARGEAEAALRERDQVLATVSHDLKTPLSTIRGQAQFLRRRASRSGGLDLERTLKGLELIEAAAEKMTSWIDELLDTARLETGRPLELRCESTDLVALTWQVAAEQQRTTARHRIRVHTQEARLIGLWDPARLARVLDNLVANALKYSPEGGEIDLEVEPATEGNQRWAVVRIRDQGLGIPQADQPHIFERFRRGANVVGRIAGTGIGLAGASQLVQQHGGRLEVSSQEGRGSTFTVRLPLLPS
jgi:PAS domain S-box-containing protein